MTTDNEPLTTDKPLKALTIWQPWASLLACKAKRYETRGWSTRYRGPIAIHAAKRWMHRQLEFCRSPIVKPILEQISKTPAASPPVPVGSFLAVGELVEVHPIDHFFNRKLDERELALGNFEHGRFAWEITNLRWLDKPMEFSGQQGLWDVPPGYAGQLRSRLVGARDQESGIRDQGE